MGFVGRGTPEQTAELLVSSLDGSNLTMMVEEFDYETDHEQPECDRLANEEEGPPALNVDK